MVSPSPRASEPLRRNRRVRDGAIQAAYAAAALAAAILLPKITVGPAADAQRTAGLLQAIAGGLIMFMALVFSLLFLVMQYASANLSPRLLLFRDQPLVWHALGTFLGAFVYTGAASLRSARTGRVSLLVPAVAIGLVLAALYIARRVQLRAFAAVQLGSVVATITRRGLAINAILYPPGGDDAPASASPATGEPSRIVVWPHREYAVLRQIDVSALLALQPPTGTGIVTVAMAGTVLQPGTPVFTFHGLPPVQTDRELLKLADTGTDRTFDQDPLLAFRLLSDIALRALSPAVNDPATAIQSIDGLENLLRDLASHALPTERVYIHGRVRVALPLPGWPQYVQAATEAIPYALAAPTVRHCYLHLLDQLTAATPPYRHPPLEQARRTLTTNPNPTA